MVTYYKPSQWRGKRLVYRSIDPDEPKREKIRIIAIVVVPIMMLAAAWLLLRFLN
jgi:hypothetical protein